MSMPTMERVEKSMECVVVSIQEIRRGVRDGDVVVWSFGLLGSGSSNRERRVRRLGMRARLPGRKGYMMETGKAKGSKHCNEQLSVFDTV